MGELTEDVYNHQKEILRQIKNKAKKDKLQSSNEEASAEELQQSQSNHVSNNVNYENAYQVPEGNLDYLDYAGDEIHSCK